MLEEIPLTPSDAPLPERAAAFIEEGLRRSKGIDCFDFIPSDYRVVYGALGVVAVGRFCEWGSGIGIVTGLAAMLGFGAMGIELHAELAAASRELLADFGLKATIVTGDYLERADQADVYFVYCWPGQMNRVEERLERIAPAHARLLICHGAEDVRCKVKTPGHAQVE
jgi:hypothetical protein